MLRNVFRPSLSIVPRARFVNYSPCWQHPPSSSRCANAKIICAIPLTRSVLTKTNAQPATQVTNKQSNSSLEKARATKEAAKVGHDPSTILSETIKSKQEQRQADWRIIKDMVQYLWPKNDISTRSRVGLSVILLLGAKVSLILCRSTCSADHTYWPDLERAGSVLF